MKRKKNPFLNWRVLMTGTGVGLCVMGQGFAMWSDSLHVNTRMNTADFNMVFSEEQGCEAALVDEDGNELMQLNTEWTLTKERKQAEIIFKDGVGSDILSGENGFLNLSFELKAADETALWNVAETINREAEYDEDTIGRERGALRKLEPEGVILLLNGVGYEAEELCGEFITPMECYVNYEAERNKDTLLVSQYLQLTEKSASKTEELPTVMELPTDQTAGLKEAEGDWPQMEPVIAGDTINSSDSGVVVLYTCELPLYLDQAEVDCSVDPMALIGGIRAYGYWVDCLNLQMRIPVMYPMDVVVTEETESAENEENT